MLGNIQNAGRFFYTSRPASVILLTWRFYSDFQLINVLNLGTLGCGILISNKFVFSTQGTVMLLCFRAVLLQPHCARPTTQDYMTSFHIVGSFNMSILQRKFQVLAWCECGCSMDSAVKSIGDKFVSLCHPIINSIFFVSTVQKWSHHGRKSKLFSWRHYVEAKCRNFRCKENYKKSLIKTAGQELPSVGCYLEKPTTHSGQVCGLPLGRVFFSFFFSL